MSKSLKVIHISDLNGAQFNIPGYQRGYRWETKHVHALLKDILEFDSSSEPFYCLQPLVVVKNEDLSKNSEKVIYDVIDGQQRLTTLFLILHCTNNTRLDYSLRYERLGTGASNKYDDERVLKFDQLCNPTEEQISKTADYFYLYQAIKDIKQWIKVTQERISDPAAIVGDCIAPSRYRRNNYLTEEGIDDPNKGLKDVRFIWYDAGNDEVHASNIKTTPIATFRRLNHGKTPLTAAELIKALLFQCDLYSDDIKALMKEVAFRRSTEWNDMEIRLQNPFLWNMICPIEYNRPSHIDLVLSFVAQDLLAELPEGSIKTLENDSDYDYQVFDTYLRYGIEDGEIGDIYREKVEYIWNKIHDCFSVFINWYEDRTIYHYIGLLVTLTNRKGLVHLNFLRELKKKYEESIRPSFIHHLKAEIARKIILNGNDRIEDLNYLDNWDSIVNILKVFNVQKTLDRESEGQRFSFEFCRQMTPSLEHIHPQHLAEGDIPFDTLCNWYQDKKFAILNSGNSSIIEALHEPISILDLYLTKESGEKKYKENLEECKKSIAIIDELFDTLANIDEAALHNICNMALVDKETNSALGNKMMDGKRVKLYERAKLFDSSNHEKGAYIMTGTWMVFNKEFSEDVRNMKFWEPEDRKKYLEAIEDVYNDFITYLNK